MDSGSLARVSCVLFFCLILASLGAASGFESTNIQEDETVWFYSGGPDIEAQEFEGMVSCTAEDKDFQGLILNNATDDQRSLEVEENKFNYDFKESDGYGAYKAVLECGQNSYEYEFALNSFSIDSYSYEKSTVYQSEIQRVTFYFDVDGVEYDPSELEIMQSNNDIEIYDLERISESRSQATFRFRISTNEEPRDNMDIFWDLSLGNKFTLQPGSDDVFDLREPWHVITPEKYIDESISVQELSENRDLFEVDATYRGENHGFRPEHFKITILDSEGNQVFEEFSMETEASDNSRLVKIGEDQFSRIENSLERGEFTFQIWIDENEDYLIDEFTVYNHIIFSGTLENSNSNSVDAFFEIEKDGNLWRSFYTNNGEYSEPVLPGLHNVSMRTEDDVTFMFDNTEFGEDGQRRIMYDRIPRAELDDIEGVTVVKAFAALYGYPFETGRINVQHRFGDVNPDNPRVIRCNDWSMNRECGGEWENFDSNEISVDPTIPSIEFPIQPDRLGNQSYLISAYALVENQDLVADIELETSRMPVGEEVGMNGQVLASDSPVDQVDIRIDILDGDEVVSSYTDQTDSEGRFETSITAPEESGVYDVRVTGEKEPYTDFDLTESGAIDTYVQREITIDGPSQSEFRTGETSQVTYTVTNSGQEDLDDIRFRISGLNNDWYSISQDSWDTLAAGQSITVEVQVEIPENYFDGENLENDHYDVEVRGLSSEGEINQIESTIGTITNEHLYGSSSEDVEDSNEPRFNSPDLTGEFIQSTSTMNIALGVIMLFTTMLAAAVKKNKSGSNSDRGRRGGDRSSPISSATSSSTQGMKPNVSPNTEKTDNTGSSSNDENSVDEGGSVKESQEPTSETDEHKCDVCGESFDTASAVKLHKQAMH